MSDFPFRQVCADYGAQLTYVEMLTARAIIHANTKTMAMLKVRRGTGKLGVQVTGPTADEIYQAIRIIDDYDYDTIDINMGCPVRKVVNNGSGSALLRDPAHTYRVVAAARRATDKPLSAKIRLGWTRDQLNYLEVGRAIADAGGEWITVHGRTRNERYDRRVDLDSIAHLKQQLSIPVIGNGDLFTVNDFRKMHRRTAVDALMISRGALGNPWLFQGQTTISIASWLEGVERHLTYQQQEYGDEPGAARRMRKHLLWYVKGWPQARTVKEKITTLSSLTDAVELIKSYASTLDSLGADCRVWRSSSHQNDDYPLT